MLRDPVKVVFGDRLRATAAVCGYRTAQSIADLCGAERATVAAWLNGRSSPKWQEAAKLCAAWNVTLDWLAVGKPDGVPHGLYIRIVAAMQGLEDAPGAAAPALSASPASCAASGASGAASGATVGSSGRSAEASALRKA